jgi:hypothetical protein
LVETPQPQCAAPRCWATDGIRCSEQYRIGRGTIAALRESVEGFTFSMSLAVTRVLHPGEIYAPHAWSDDADIPVDFGYSPPIPMDDHGRPRFVGDPDEVAADIQDYLDAGVRHFTLRFSTGADAGVSDYFDQLQRFAGQVMDRFSTPPDSHRKDSCHDSSRSDWRSAH